MQRGVALLVLAGDFSSVVYQQRHDVQVTWTNTAAKTSLTFRRQFDNSLCPQRSLRASFTASVFPIQPASWKIVNEHLLSTLCATHYCTSHGKERDASVRLEWDEAKAVVVRRDSKKNPRARTHEYLSLFKVVLQLSV